MRKLVTTALIVCVGMIGLAWTGCSTVEKTTEKATGTDIPEMKYKTLKPSMIDSAWSFLDKKEKNPFAQKESKLEYATIGTSKYDTYFKDSAKLIGSIRFADKHLTRLNKLADSGVIKKLIAGDRIQKLVGEKADLSLKERKQIASHTFQGNFDQIASKMDSVSKEAVTDFKKGLYKDYPNLKPVTKWHGPLKKTFKPKTLKKKATELANKSQKLAQQAKKDFTGPKAKVAPKLAKELTSTGKKLGKTSKRIPKIAKKLGQATSKIGKQIKEGSAERAKEVSAK